jgi:hypothetical protein
VDQLFETRRAIHGVATRHRVIGLRWWPPAANVTSLDFLVEGLPGSLPAFRADLERAVGCQVAVYLAIQIPQEAWGRILVDAVAV